MLNRLAKNIWQWCEEREIWVFASYIPSKENTNADRESRKTNIDTEWKLSEKNFSKIVRRWQKPEIDLFATRINAKVRKFCAWKRDPEAWCIDAFTLNWGQLFFYAFPLFSILTRVLQKIILDKAEGVLIAPYWPTQPWFPVFKSLLLDEPLIFNPSPNLLLSPCRSLNHPLSSQLSLVAGKLSGKHINGNSCHKKPSSFLSPRWLTRLKNSTTQL